MGIQLFRGPELQQDDDVGENESSNGCTGRIIQVEDVQRSDGTIHAEVVQQNVQVSSMTDRKVTGQLQKAPSNGPVIGQTKLDKKIPKFDNF